MVGQERESPESLKIRFLYEVPDLMGIFSSEPLIKTSCQFITQVVAKLQHLEEE